MTNKHSYKILSIQLLKPLVFTLFVLGIVLSNIDSIYAQDTGASGPACRLSLGIHTSPKTVKSWDTAVTVTVTLSRSYSPRYFCSNIEKASISFFYETAEGVGPIEGSASLEMPPDEVGKPSYKNEAISRTYTLINGTEKSDSTKRIKANAVVIRTPRDQTNVSIGATQYENLTTEWATIKRDPNTKEPQTTTTTGTNPPTNTNTNTAPPNNSKDNALINTGVTATYKEDLDSALGYFTNPLTKDTLPELLASILKILFILIGMISVIIIIIAGFRMVLASGNEAELTKAKAAITWAIIGLIVSLMSFSIVAIIQRLIQVGA